MRGTLQVPFSTLVQDTIATHGLRWSVWHYCVKNKLTTREFRIFSGI